MRFLRLSLVLASLTSPSVLAEGKEELGKRLLEASGLKSQLEQLPQILDGELKRQRKRARLTPEQFSAFTWSVRDRFAVSSFYPALEEGFLEAVDEKALQEVDRWYQSPLGMKVVELEKKASRPEARPELEQFARSMRTKPPPARRVKLVRSLDKAARGTDTALDMVLGITRGMTRGLASATSGKPAAGMTAAQLKKLRAQLRPALQGLALVSFLYTYRTLSDRELEEYLKFLSSPSGRAFQGAIAKGLEAAFEEASARIGQDLVKVAAPAGKRTRR